MTEWKQHEPDARTVYGDIIDLPHHQSSTHPHMSLYDRAAQFSPFQALTGYGDMITEEARLTERKKEQDVRNINTKLGIIAAAIDAGRNPTLGFTVFVPDAVKDGGEYVEISGIVKRVDPVHRNVVLFAENGKSDGGILEFRYIQDIYGEAVDYVDDSYL